MKFEFAQYVDLKYFDDDRGYFAETLNISKHPFNQLQYIQSNMSCNHAGALRGMHYQVTKPQGKLCYVASGRAFDFVIDLRKSSPDFLQVRTFLLETKGAAVWVPPGYAHGFFSLEDKTMFCYHVFGNSWFKDDECSINPLSVPDIISAEKHAPDFIVSTKDMAGYDFLEQSYPTYE